MREIDFINPNNNYPQYPDSFVEQRLADMAELKYGVLNLPKTVWEKVTFSRAEAQEFLLLAQDALVQSNQSNLYFSESKKPEVEAKLGSGYYSFVYPFGDSVIKLSASHSPMLSHFQPSSQEYAEWYQSALDIQRVTYGEHLPFLIPEPQTVLHIKGSNSERTVILEPRITDILSKEEIKNLSSEEQSDLFDEFELFQAIAKEVSEGFGLVPDYELFTFIRNSSHFVISKQHGKPHLVMLDNGMFDEKGANKLFFELNKRKEKKVIEGLKQKIK